MSQKSIAVVGSGITGVMTAYALVTRGYSVTVYDRNRYPAMDTSFANGGQLSASNAEVWTHTSTLLKGLKWMFRKDAPLLMNLSPSWHKYSWLAEFIGNIGHYERNTVETARLAVAARTEMIRIARTEGIAFDREDRGILHFYKDRTSYQHAEKVSRLLAKGGCERRPLSPAEIREIEPTLRGTFYGGFLTPGDATGDIHLFTNGLAAACRRHGVQFRMETEVTDLKAKGEGEGVTVRGRSACDPRAPEESWGHDALVICAGAWGRELARLVGDRLNVYPVKGYSITVMLEDEASQKGAPWVSLLDDAAKIVTSRFGVGRFRVAGTAEFAGYNRDIRANRVKPLIAWVNQHFPEVSTRQYAPWAGLRPMMPSMMPRVGAGRRPGIFYNTGHGHLGWTLSAATAEAISAQISAAVPA